jgi:hypothetical protein
MQFNSIILTITIQLDDETVDQLHHQFEQLHNRFTSYLSTQRREVTI